MSPGCFVFRGGFSKVVYASSIGCIHRRYFISLAAALASGMVGKREKNGIQCIYRHMGADRYSTDLFYAGRFCPLRSRADESKKHRQHPDEEHDGFLYRDPLFLAGWFRLDVRQHSSAHRQTGSHDPGPLRCGKYSRAAAMPLWCFVIFQTVFCATAATIVSALWQSAPILRHTACIPRRFPLVYPVGGHWAWGGGWLSGLGFHDFAGSAVVHNVGGAIACLGAWMLGPIGKYDREQGACHSSHNMMAVAPASSSCGSAGSIQWQINSLYG